MSHPPVEPEPDERPSDPATREPAGAEVDARSLGPVSEPERIHAMDALRGVAIFGIFMVNISFFSMPLVKLIDRSLMADAAWGDQIAWAIVRAGFEFKFIGLFSLLFGMGLAMQAKRAADRGRPFVPVYLRRTFLLMGLGLIHGVLIWYGDILFMYSIVALLALLLRKLSARVLLTIAAVAIVISVATMALGAVMGVLGDQAAREAAVAAESEAGATGAGETETEDTVADVVDEPDPAVTPAVSGADDRWERFTAAVEALFSGDPDSQGDAGLEAETIAYKEGPMLATILMRSAEFFLIVLVGSTLGGFGFRVLAMFLIGMVLMRADFFDAARRRWHWLFAILGLGLGVPGELWMVMVYRSTAYQVSWTQAGAEVVHAACSFALCLGYVGVITLLAHSGAGRVLLYPFRCVGRLALTNYISQSLIATYIMYWYGLGYFNEFDRVSQLALVVSIFAGQVVLSIIWLRFFTIGPLEWVWRSLTYGRRQPLRRD